MSQAPRLWRLARPIAAIVTLLAIVAGLLAPTATAQTGGGYPPPGGAIGSISGRVVDADTGLPLQAGVALYQCSDFGCSFASSQFTVEQGQFLFENQPFVTLPAGAYYIIASAAQYEPIQTATFTVAEGEHFAIGDIALPRTQAIGSIRGRLIDSETGQPVSSFFPTNAQVTLLSCSDAITCTPVSGTYPQSDGLFTFNSGTFQVFPPGLYAVEVFSDLYDTLRTTPVQVGLGEDRDLGDVALVARPVFNSLSGRLIDSVTGGPLPGESAPFARVSLVKCQQFFCSTISNIAPDPSGRFRFDSTNVSLPLLTGTYFLSASADQYVQVSTDSFSPQAGQDLNIGNIRIQSYAVRFSNTQGCENIPAAGGICRYSVRVTSGMATILNASSWSVVTAQSFLIPPSQPNSGGLSVFQPEPARNLRLRPGQSQVLQFEFRVPAGAANGTSMCVNAFISQDRTTRLFNTIGQTQLFCIVKIDTGPFRRMTDQEIRDMERDGRGPRRP